MPLKLDSELFDKVDYAVNKEPKCPHCDVDINIAAHELYDLYEEGEHRINCPYCDKEFKVVSEATWTFSTDEQDYL